MLWVLGDWRIWVFACGAGYVVGMACQPGLWLRLWRDFRHETQMARGASWLPFDAAALLSLFAPFDAEFRRAFRLRRFALGFCAGFCAVWIVRLLRA